MTSEKDMTFEMAMKQLETIVKKLEQGDVEIEKALEYYQEGMKLSKICTDKLTHVQEKMVQIMNEQGETLPFEVQED
ncbi:MAG TPA: exodeoxyribonuclease VII small subunit [Cerasibacillus sp.]|uniref:exodeoxyribonuclease VII small subunit n=1 Tax=Cerasibacillus sp. TaxID=2498711 RepID=UPI002F3F4CE4